MEQPRQLLMGSSDIDLNNVGDKLSWPISAPMKIARVGVVMTSTDANDATIKFDRRVTAGSDSGRVAGACGIISKLASNQQGKVLVEDEAASQDLVLDAGDEIVVNVTAENCNANAFCRPFVEYYRLSESTANESDAVAS
jgi:hypothetical protein